MMHAQRDAFGTIATERFAEQMAIYDRMREINRADHQGRPSMKSYDFRVDNHGSIVILNALNDDARAWVEAHLPEERQTWGRNGTVVEPRYIGDIVEGISNDGFSVDW